MSRGGEPGGPGGTPVALPHQGLASGARLRRFSGLDFRKKSNFRLDPKLMYPPNSKKLKISLGPEAYVSFIVHKTLHPKTQYLTLGPKF